MAVDGREKTFIVGAAAPGGDANGMGAGATRCILHHRGAGGAFYNGKPAIVEGFTICGGRTASGDNDSKYYAAGVLDAPGNEDQGRYAIWLVDCTISNCVAGVGGATRFGSLYRSLVADCGASYRVAAVHSSRLHSCIIAYCAENSAAYGLAHGATAVNCTFFMNRRRMTSTTAYNCVFANDAGITGEPDRVDSTSTAVDGVYQLFAPALGDWRLKSGARAIGLGTVANLSKVSVPDDANVGTENAPFKSIQKAVDAAAANTYTVIYAAAGDYNTGADGAPGKIHADSHPLTNRVYIGSNKQVFIRGAGAGKSFITVALNLAADSAVTVTLNGVSTTYDTAGRHEFRFDDAANPQGAFQIACTSGTADILAADVFIGMVIFFR